MVAIFADDLGLQACGEGYVLEGDGMTGKKYRKRLRHIELRAGTTQEFYEGIGRQVYQGCITQNDPPFEADNVCRVNEALDDDPIGLPECREATRKRCRPPVWTPGAVWSTRPPRAYRP